MKRILVFCSFLVIMLSLGAQTMSPASPSGFQSTTNNSAYFYSGSLSGSEQLKIYTYIWGQVVKPGLYIVPDDTDLLTLISLAGGPTENAKLSQVRIIRPTAEGQKILYINLKEYLETGNEKLIPMLKPGDTVVMSGSVYYAFYRFSDFFAKLATIVAVISAINNM